MKDFPDHIIIVDDSPRQANILEEQIKDLSWIPEFEKKYRINIPKTIKELSRLNPHKFEEDIENVKIEYVKDITREAMGVLCKSGQSLAFIDFYYNPTNTKFNLDDINNIYKNIEEIWQKADDAVIKQGGCICANYFEPSAEPPIRVMVPSTEYPPKGIFDVSEAITNDQSLRRDPQKNARKAIIKGLRKWVDLKTSDNPMDDIWTSTKHWFSGGGSELPKPARSDGPPQSPPQSWHWPHDWPSGEPRPGGAADFLTAVENAFGLELPDRWTRTRDFLPLYESIKGLCGDSYCGEGGKNNLKMGSVLLIALLALEETNVDYKKSIEDIEPSDLLAANSKFLKRQPSYLAKHTAKSLYYFLKYIFKDDPKHKSQRSEPRSLTWINGRDLVKLRVGLHWDATEGLVDTIMEERFCLPQKHPGAQPSNTRESIEWLWSGLLRSSKGFGHPGSVMIEKAHLKITAPAKTE